MPTQKINLPEQVNDSNIYNIVPSISSNNLVVALKRADGTNDASASYPLSILVGTTRMNITASLSVTVPSSAGDVFGWDGGKIQANDAQLFVYLINNNGTPQIGVSPCPTLTTVATNYYDGSQTGSAGHTNIVMSGTRNATNSCTVIGRINVNQADNNNWQNPTTSKIINYPIWDTDYLGWSLVPGAVSPMGFVSVTTNMALYRVSRDACFINAEVLGTTSGTASPNLTITLPIISKYVEASFISPMASIVQSVGAFAVGMTYIVNSPNNLLFFGKYDLSNFGIGANCRGVGAGFYKVS